MIALPAVLREEPRFRLLWAGQALSLFGDLVKPVALAFAVLAIGSAGDLAIVVASGLAPFAIFALAGGVWADRLGRREVMIASDLVRFAVQGAIAVLLLTGEAQVWMLAALTAVFGVADALFSPALAGLIPEVVPPRRIQDANAVLALTRNVATIGGPLLAGVLVAAAGPGEAIAVDAVTFVLSAAVLTRLPRSVRPAAGDPRPGFTEVLREGWAIVRARSWLLGGLGAEAVYTLIVLPSIFVLGPVLAKQELNGASSWAIISAAYGAGSIAGNVIALRWRPPRPMVAVAGTLMVASTQAAIIGSGLPVAGIAGLEAVAGIGVALYWTLWDTTIQSQVPPEAVARVASYDYGIAVGFMPVGLLVAVPVAHAIGLHATLHLMTVAGVLAGLLLLALPGVRALRAVRAQPSASARTR